MRTTHTGAESLSGTGSHFQMFLAGHPARIRWRLLSGNNRDMCHGVADFADPQLCRDAIAQLVATVHLLKPLVKRDDKGDWTWALLDNGDAVATAGHSYDRQIRCTRAMGKVLVDVPRATIRTQMLVSDHRRWAGASRILSAAPLAGSARRLST